MLSHVRERVQRNADWHAEMADRYTARAGGGQGPTEPRPEEATEAPDQDSVMVRDQVSEGAGGSEARRSMRRGGAVGFSEETQPPAPVEENEDTKAAVLHAGAAEQLRDLVKAAPGRAAIVADREELAIPREQAVVTRRGSRPMDTRAVRQGAPVRR